MQLTVPNLLSLSRLALAIAFVFVRSSTLQAAIIIVGGLSDFVDGFIARRFGQRTRAGELLDPVTDKLFVLTVVVTLLARGTMRLTDVLLLLTRDLFATGAYILAKVLRLPMRFKSRFSGKVVTTLQFAALVTFVAVPAWSRGMLIAVVIASIYAIIDYARTGLGDLRRPSAGT